MLNGQHSFGVEVLAWTVLGVSLVMDVEGVVLRFLFWKDGTECGCNDLWLFCFFEKASPR